MRKAIYPGTFDPITNGHIDIIKRASAIFEDVIVAVVKQSSKDILFPYAERLAMVKAVTKNMNKVRVKGFDGLVVNFAQAQAAKVIVRGLRMISDFEYEFQMALTNRNLSPQIETIFLMPHPQYSYVSSRLIKEAAHLGANLKSFLPPQAMKALRRRTNENRGKRLTR